MKLQDRMIPRLVAAAMFLSVFSLSGRASGGENPPDASRLKEYIDRFDAQFSSCMYKDAERIIKEAMNEYPGNADLLWRYANLVINEGDVAEDREPFYRKSIGIARSAVEADGNNANAHAIMAAAYGSVAMFEGGEGKVKLANKIKDELDIALKLDRDNFIAHTIYGTWHREVADVSWVERKLADIFLGGLPDGSFKESVRHFRAALKLRPEVLRNRYELGLTYIAMDREDLAAKEFRIALKLTPTMKADYSRKRRMKKFLEDYEG